MKKIILISSLAIIVLLISCLLLSHVQAKDFAEAGELKVWIVRKGDTLWNIAKLHRGQTEIRKYIYQIQKLNDIDSIIYPGQKLMLPQGK
jgi:nucleoid-associated protein YgaU